jgi:hypothetical protein
MGRFSTPAKIKYDTKKEKYYIPYMWDYDEFSYFTIISFCNSKKKAKEILKKYVNKYISFFPKEIAKKNTKREDGYFGWEQRNDNTKFGIAILNKLNKPFEISKLPKVKSKKPILKPKYIKCID